MRITLFGLLLIGCGGSDGTSHEGIYRVDTWTNNTAACTEGASVAAMNNPLFYVKNESFFGESFVNVNGCDDIAMCKDLANDKGTVHIGMFGFDGGGDGGGWTSHSAFAFEFQGQCEGGVTDTTLTITSSMFRIESKHIEAIPFAATTGEDECPEDQVEKAAEGQPCSELEVVTATFMEDF